MPFVQRGSDGKITGYWSNPQTDEQRRLGEDGSPDWLPDNHPEIAEFHESQRRTMARLMRESGRRATQDIPFIASRLKLKRADDHATELQRAIDDYRARIPVREIRSQLPADARYMKYELVCVERPPVYLAAILGDAVHNLRAALDLLAVDLVLLNDGNEKGVHFPFASSAAELEANRRQKGGSRKTRGR